MSVDINNYRHFRTFAAMNATNRTADRVLKLFAGNTLVRPRDLDALSIPRRYMSRLEERGVVERTGRGLYMLPASQPSELHTLLQAAKRVPQGVVCLLSALQYHGLTTQAPYEIWMAIDPKARKPHVSDLPLNFVRFSGAALEEGVESHEIEGVRVNVYSAAKTIADCFKYRNKIGLDVALEALREYRKQKGASMDALWRYAKVCRVANVMRPYMESLT